MTNTPPTDRELAKLWLEAVRTEKVSSANTLSSYRLDLNKYLAFLEGRDLTARTAVQSDVLQLFADLRETGSAESTVRRLRSTIRQFHAFLVVDGHSGADPTASLGTLPRIALAPYILPIDDVHRLLDTAHAIAAEANDGDLHKAVCMRRAALLETMYASGLTVSEAICLQWTAFRKDGRGLDVVGRGGKSRWVPINAKAVEAIHSWSECAARYGRGSSDWVFYSLKDACAHIRRQTAFKEFQEILEIAAISNADRISPNSLRHAFGAHLLKNGVDLAAVQTMLGHAEMGTLEVYAEAMDDDAHATLEKHPLGESFAEQ